MAEQDSKQQAGAAQDEGQKSVQIQQIFIKDFSFESPQSPGIFTAERFAPEFSLNLATRKQALQGDSWEVVLEVSVEARQDDKTVFLAELQQAGVFALRGFTEEELDMMTASFCASQLYPYAREVISSLVVKGGFPAPQLQPVNFDHLYARQRQQQAEQGEQQA